MEWSMHRVPVPVFHLCGILGLLAPLSIASAAQPSPPSRYVVVPQARPSGDVTFEPVVDLQQHPSGMAPQLRGAREANTDEWPASFYLTFKSPEGKEKYCTAALLGPQVVLTA